MSRLDINTDPGERLIATQSLKSFVRNIGINLAGIADLRKLEGMSGESTKHKSTLAHEEILSGREVDVLRLLAAGESYKEIVQKLFLSLNTVQFHVKSIYRKLLVNKRTQAIEKAREMNWI